MTGGYSDGKTLVRNLSLSSVSYTKSKITVGVPGRLFIRDAQTATPRAGLVSLGRQTGFCRERSSRLQDI